MPLERLLAVAPLVALCPLLLAQKDNRGVYFSDHPGPNRTFALVQGDVVMVNGSWRDRDGVSDYAHAHPGHYIVFTDGKALHRLDNAERVAEAEQAYAPMIPLNARQKELAAEQKPLADQQRALAEKQRAAEGNPEEQGRIGEQQGRLGEQQGAIGGKQGEIGRQQGEVGVAFYNKVQSMLSACLADGSCPTVAPDNARR